MYNVVYNNLVLPCTLLLAFIEAIDNISSGEKSVV